jgi:hypothetical protein
LKISFIKPRPELAPFVESFWVFESPSGFPATDASIAAPNGCAKLIIPYENSPPAMPGLAQAAELSGLRCNSRAENERCRVKTTRMPADRTAAGQPRARPVVRLGALEALLTTIIGCSNVIVQLIV